MINNLTINDKVRVVSHHASICKAALNDIYRHMDDLDRESRIEMLEKIEKIKEEFCFLEKVMHWEAKKQEECQ